MSRLEFNLLKEKEMKDLFKLTMTMATLAILAAFPTACNTTTVCSVETVAANLITSAVASPLLLNCNSAGYATIQAAALWPRTVILASIRAGWSTVMPAAQRATGS